MPQESSEIELENDLSERRLSKKCYKQYLIIYLTNNLRFLSSYFLCGLYERVKVKFYRVDFPLFVNVLGHLLFCLLRTNITFIAL